MAGSSLDIAIGLIFIYLLFSLFLSTALEAVAAVLKLRARALEIAVKELIEDPTAPATLSRLPAKGLFGLLAWFQRGFRSTSGDPLVADKVDPDMPEVHEGPTEIGDGLPVPVRFQQVFRHPLVAPGGARPSYIPTANFVTALLQAVRVEGAGSPAADVERGLMLLPDGVIRQALTSAVIEAQGDWDKLRAEVEAWFDNAMDRLSGVYKRFSQAITFFLALALAYGYGLDSIAIVERLMSDPPLRAQLVADAGHYVGTHTTPVLNAANPPQFDATLTAIKQAQVELAGTSSLVVESPPAKASQWFSYAIGLLITALAAMLGAPFWFDVLQKLVNLRGAGPKPDSAQANAAGANT